MYLASPKPPVCRRPGCAADAVGPLGFCLHHDLRYAEWRDWRDRLERDDLDGTGVDPGGPIDGPFADALDILYRYLTPGPFTAEDRDDRA